jgi:hypothetical protein
MKNKLCVIAFLVMFSLNSLFAVTTNSTLFDRDSFVVTSVNYLARRSSIIGIYDSFPTTGANVLYTFNQIDRGSLTDIEQNLYDQISEELNKKANLVNKERISANLQFPFTVESSFYKTEDGSQLYQYELVNQHKDVAPWFDVRNQLYYGDYFYGYTQFAVKDEMKYEMNSLALNIDTNLDSYSLIPTDSPDFEIYQPYKIGLSVGDDVYNFQIGKNRLSMGSGITGNFFIGDNFSKQDYASFSLFSSFASYTLSVSEFDQQSSSLGFDSISFNGKHQYRVMNKFRIEILKNLSLDVYQGALFQVDNINLRMITPFMYVHNYFNFADRVTLVGNDEANNILGIQAKWVMNEGNEFNFILTFDQIQISESDEVFPQAYGLLLNYKNTFPLFNGFINNSWEIVYTSPYLYLNEKENSDGTSNYNYDHILGNNYGTYDEIGYSGYYYGPDTIMFATALSYTDLNRWMIGGDARIRLHGEKGIKYLSNIEDTIGTPENDSLIVGVPEVIFSFMPKGSFRINKYLTIDGYVNFETIFNHYHNTSAEPFYDIQAKISARMNLL